MFNLPCMSSLSFLLHLLMGVWREQRSSMSLPVQSGVAASYLPVQATLLPPRLPLQLPAMGATCLKGRPTQKATMVVKIGATMTVGSCHTHVLQLYFGQSTCIQHSCFAVHGAWPKRWLARLIGVFRG